MPISACVICDKNVFLKRDLQPSNQQILAQVYSADRVQRPFDRYEIIMVS